MTIHELLQAAGLTANDEIPIWDVDGTGEPTKKITAQQLAAAVVALANLVTGVKGDKESNYRHGDVNLTPANIGAKPTQTAVADPTASGTAVAFIDSITQNANGVITPTKKTVRSASQSESGLMSATDKTKLDGIAAGAQVNSLTGVKGNAESSYRTGNVNLTPANIGALAVGEEIPLLSNPLAINNGTMQYTASEYHPFSAYKFVDLYFIIQGGYTNAIRLCPEYGNKTYKFGFFAWNSSDNHLRKDAVTFKTSGRYFTNCVMLEAYGDNGVFNTADNSLYLYKAIGYKW